MDIIPPDDKDQELSSTEEAGKCPCCSTRQSIMHIYKGLTFKLCQVCINLLESNIIEVEEQTVPCITFMLSNIYRKMYRVCTDLYNRTSYSHPKHLFNYTGPHNRCKITRKPNLSELDDDNFDDDNDNPYEFLGKDYVEEPPDDTIMLSTADVAKCLSLDRSTIVTWSRNNYLPAIRKMENRHYEISLDELIDWVNSKKVA